MASMRGTSSRARLMSPTALIVTDVPNAAGTRVGMGASAPPAGVGGGVVIAGGGVALGGGAGVAVRGAAVDVGARVAVDASSFEELPQDASMITSGKTAGRYKNPSPFRGFVPTLRHFSRFRGMFFES